jgi:hypothetical protein
MKSYLSVRELRKAGRLGPDESAAEVPGKRQRRGSPTPRAKFTDRFQIGDWVSITRWEHGWVDGGVTGRITAMTDYSCNVQGEDGHNYPIDKPRDIHKIMGRR